MHELVYDSAHKDKYRVLMSAGEFDGGPYRLGGSDHDYMLVSYSKLDALRLAALADIEVLFFDGPRSFSNYQDFLDRAIYHGYPQVGMLTLKGIASFERIKKYIPEARLLYKEYSSGMMEPELFLLPNVVAPPKEDGLRQLFKGKLR